MDDDVESQRRREECERKARRGEMDPRLEFAFQLLIDGTGLERHKIMDHIFEGDMVRFSQYSMDRVSNLKSRSLPSKYSFYFFYPLLVLPRLLTNNICSLMKYKIHKIAFTRTTQNSILLLRLHQCFKRLKLDEINQLFLPNMRNKLLWFYQEVDEPETVPVQDITKPGPSRTAASTTSKTPQGNAIVCTY